MTATARFRIPLDVIHADARSGVSRISLRVEFDPDAADRLTHPFTDDIVGYQEDTP